MALSDLFDKDKRRERRLAKLTERAQQKYGAAEGRAKALDTLRADGSPEALYGMLHRFGVRVEQSITDQEEKKWVHDVLVSVGGPAVEPIRRYVRKAEAVTWPLRALAEIQGPKGVGTFVRELLAEMAEDYQRGHDKKINLIRHLAELEGARGPDDDASAQVLCRFLDDLDHDTVIAALEALERLDAEGVSRAPVLELLREQGEDNPRLRSQIFHLFAAQEWVVKGARPTVEALLLDGYRLTSDGRVVREGAQSA